MILLTGCGDDGGSARPDAPVVTGEAPAITTAAALPELNVGALAAPVQFVATGDAPITWSISAGAAPAGMTLADTGTYSGTPTAPGSFTFTVTATNAAGTDTLDVTQTVLAPDATAVALLADNRIATFAPGFPALAGSAIALSGVVTGETLVAIDRRPVNGQLYGLGTNAGNTNFSLYAIHPASGSAVAIGAPQSFSTTNADGVFGLDINPAVDRVRVVTGTGMNFRVNPNTGIVIDSDANGGNGNQRDTNLNGATGGATETAYTNNKINNASITTHYTVNDGVLYLQNPSNAGTLTTVATIAGVQKTVGFDVAPGIDSVTANTPVSAGLAYAVVSQTGQTTQLGGTLDLVTAVFSTHGTFPMTDIRGLALTTGERTVVGLANDGTTLLRFHESTPNSVGFVTLATITAGESLVGIDFRPSTGQLYALGINATANTGTLYLVDPTAGGLTPVAASIITLVDTGGATTDLPDPASVRYGFDFNSAVDRIRVVTSTGLNFRINPNTGAPVDADLAEPGTNPDLAINGAGGLSGLDNVSYTNGYPGTGAAVSTAYGISGTTNALYLIANPNAGTVGTKIDVTSGGSALDFSAACAFDIPQTVTTSTSNAPVTAGVAYAVLTVGVTTRLYRIELVSGVATAIATVGAGSTSLIDVAVGQ